MSEMLLTLSKARGTQESLPEAVYEETRSFIEDTIRHSTDTFLHKSHFYHSLSPRLQNKVVRQVLFKQISQFKYFFNDYVQEIYAPFEFVKGVVTQL